jgi:streptomycin 6-kinase
VESGAPIGLAEWVSGLTSSVEEARQRWSVEIGDPYEPGGACSWVAPADLPNGGKAVLKIAFPHDESAHEAEGLRRWDGNGAVRLYDALRTRSADMLLLERCEPGTPLAAGVAEPDQDEVVAGLLRQLWVEPGRDSIFRPLSAMCLTWADELEVRAAGDPAWAASGLLDTALSIFRTFPGSADRHVLLCTDLHAENVIAAARSPWLAIDPKPYVGDPAYDPVQHMLNCPDRLDADPGKLCDRMAGLLDIGAERVRTWLFARCVQESVDPHPHRRRLRRVAERLGV